jgi:hypothetical protein
MAAAEAGRPVVEYTSNEVKMAVVGYGGATKDQVQRMVAAVLGLDEAPKPPDVADALALAVCHLNSHPLRAAVAAAGSRGVGQSVCPPPSPPIEKMEPPLSLSLGDETGIVSGTYDATGGTKVTTAGLR